MDTNQLTSIFREATDDLEPRAGFTNAVLRGGRRRKRRHRIALATSAAAALTLVTGGAYVVLGDPAPTQVATPPPKGDLAGDQQFLSSAIQEWEAGKSRSPNASVGVFRDTRGAPYVYWAGNTPTGRAAVVMQQAYLHPHGYLPNADTNRLTTLVGLVATDPVDKTFKLVADQFHGKASEPKPGYFQFGPKDRTVLAVDWGAPLFVSGDVVVEPKPKYADPQVLRKPLPVKDGVAITQLSDASFQRAVISGDEPGPGARLPMVMASEYLAMAKTGGVPGPYEERAGLPWAQGVVHIGRSGGPAFDTYHVFAEEVSRKQVVEGAADGSVASQWHIRAGLADGRVAILGDTTWSRKPARIYAVLVNPDGSRQVLEGEVVNKNSALPVKFRLPDRQGWVVANYGFELWYRTAEDGQWQHAGIAAALVPDETVQVRVGDREVADLPR